MVRSNSYPVALRVRDASAMRSDEALIASRHGKLVPDGVVSWLLIMLRRR